MRSSTPLILPPATVLVVLLTIHRSTAEEYVPAMYAFGDSTLDVGNNNYLPGNTINKANYLPNGIDYPGGTPTGRFCNGLIGIDFLAQRLGFLSSPPAALSIVDPLQDRRGVNFASGGSGILDATGRGLSLSMNQQIQLFRMTSRKRLPGGRSFLSKSMFVLSTGSNDMLDFYATTGALVQSSNDMFVTSLTNKFTAHLTRLYNLGARKFAIFGIGRVGCIPAFRSRRPSGDCVAPLNNIAQKFNRDVQDVLLDLKSTLVGMEYSFANMYEISSYILTHASQFGKKSEQFISEMFFLLGFTEVHSACCGAGPFNGRSSCTPTSTYCSDRREHLTWDHAHPTQANYELIIRLVFNDTRMFTEPLNFLQLAMI